MTFESAAEHKFREFHAKNPEVYRELVELTWQAKQAGRSKIGIGMLFEVMRWHRFFTTTDTDFKLNNNYRSRYARMIIDLNPELEGMFEVRELHS